WDASPPEVRDASILEDLELPQVSASEEEVFAIERRILAEDLSDAGRKEMLNSSSSPDLCDGRTVNRPEIRDPADQWTKQLDMLSAMAKHMELIPKERKRELLDLVMDGWLSLLAHSLGIIPALAKERHVTFNGIRYEIQFPENMSLGEVTRRIILGTDKLELQLSKRLGDDLEITPGRQQFIRVGLLSLLGTEGISEKLREVGTKLRGKRYLSEALLRQLYELAVRYRLNDAELSKIRRLAGDLATELEAVPAGQKVKRRDQIIESLTKDRLIVEMKPKPADMKKIG